MDLVLGQPPAVAAAASAADAAASATASANSAAAAAASAASLGFAPGDTVITEGGQLEVSMPIRFVSSNYTISAADRGFLILSLASLTVTLPHATDASLPPGFFFAIRNTFSGSTLTLQAVNANIDGVGSITLRPGEGFFVHNQLGNWRSIGRVATGTSGAVVPLLSAANTWSADQTITSTDAGAGQAPKLELFRDSASPAANDQIGVLEFTFRDSAGNKMFGPKVRAFVDDPTNGSEDVSFVFETLVAGASVITGRLGAGFRVGTPGGGDPGVGNINVSGGYFVNGVPLATAIAPMLPPNTNGAGLRTISTALPSGGADGDIWYQI